MSIEEDNPRCKGCDHRQSWCICKSKHAAPPLPSMPASVRELVDRIRLWPTVYKRDRELHDLAAAVEAHYAGGK